MEDEEATPPTKKMKKQPSPAQERARAYRDTRQPLDLQSVNLQEALFSLLIGDPSTDSAVESIEDEDKLKELISDQKAAILGVAKSMVGTHTDKIPDAAVGHGAFHTSFEPSHSQVSGLSINASLRFSGSGNAAYMRGMRFLSRIVVDGNATRTLGEDIRRMGTIYHFLKRLGIDFLDELKEALIPEDVTSGKPVDRGVKTIFFPINPEQDQYLSITPVSSFALTTEVNDRISRRRAERPESDILRTIFNIGGDKPRNAGMVNQGANGRNALLRGLPPAPFTASKDPEFLIAKIQRRGTLLDNPLRLHIDILLKAENDPRTNVDARNLLRDAYFQIVKGMLGTTFAINDLDVAERIKDSIPSHELALLTTKFHRIPNEDVQKLVTSVRNTIRTNIERRRTNLRKPDVNRDLDADAIAAAVAETSRELH